MNYWRQSVLSYAKENATKLSSFVNLVFNNWRLPEYTVSKNPQIQFFITITGSSVRHIWVTYI